MKRKAVGYIRVSSNNGTGESSHTMQVDAIKKYCSVNDIELVSIFNDSNNTDSTNDRWDEINAKLKELKTDASYDTFIVFKLNHLGRDVADLLRFTDELKKHGVNLISITDHIDTSQTVGNLFMSTLHIIKDNF